MTEDEQIIDSIEITFTQIKAAEEYLRAKKEQQPATIIYIYKQTYNYIFRKD